MASYDQDYARLAQRFADAMQRGQLRVITPRYAAWQERKRTGITWWLGYLRHEPRDFLYAAPRRLACRLLQRHNDTCIGKPAPHPRRW